MTNQDQSRILAWDCYFAGAMSISLHPGSGKDIGFGMAHQRSVKECAAIADEMLLESDLRFPQKEVA